jgi:hypothetical protein
MRAKIARCSPLKLKNQLKSKQPEDGRLWPKHVVLVLNGEYFNDCCIIDGLNT